MLLNFNQLILNLIQLAGDVDVFLIYPVVGCILLVTMFIFKVLSDTQKQRKLHKFELVEINKSLERLKIQYKNNHFSEMDFQKKQEELLYDIDVLKSHWMGVQVIFRSKMLYH